MSSLLSRAKSFSDLPTSGGAPANQDLITESLHPLSEGEGDSRGAVDALSLCDGAFLGRFVPDKNGTN